MLEDLIFIFRVLSWRFARLLIAFARPLVVAAIYLASLLFLGVPFFKAATIALVAIVLLMLPLGRRVVQWTALLLLIWVLSAWIDLPPHERIAAFISASALPPVSSIGHQTARPERLRAE